MNNAIIEHTPKGAVNNDGTFKIANLTGGEMRMDLAKQWANRPIDQRYTSLQSMRVAKEKSYHAATTLLASNGDIELLAPENPTTLDETRQLKIGLPNGDVAAPSNWAFQQLARLADFSPKELRKLPSQITADILNWQLNQNRNIADIQAYYNPQEILALTGPKYGRVPDYEVISAVEHIAGTGKGGHGWKIPGEMNWSTGMYDPNTQITKENTTLFASDRDCFMFLVDDLNPIEVGKVIDPRTGIAQPDLMFRGFYVTNSEVGGAALKIATFYMRAVCANRIMWGVEHFEEINIRHTKNAPIRFMEEIVPALNSYSEGSTKKLIEGVQKAKAAKVATDDEEALDFLRKRSFSKNRAKEILSIVEAEEGHPARNAWDMAQGITAIARSTPNNDTRVQIELSARKILDKVAA